MNDLNHLLANILPATVASRLKSRTDQVIADKHDDASLVFADMAGFTARASALTPSKRSKPRAITTWL
jgi:adenylate cyclase